MIEAHPSVHLEINTYTNLQERGKMVADWIEAAYWQIIVPLLGHLQRRSVERYWIGLAAWSLRGAFPRLYRFHRENWEHLLNEIRAGQLKQFSLIYKVLDEEGYPSLDSCTLQVHYLGLDFSGVAHRLVVNISRSLYGPSFTREVQQQWVDVAKQAAVVLEAVTGYITVDHAGEMSPYEISIALNPLEAGRQLRRRLRGYYWGNFLSREHILRLGGMERIRREAPCYLVEDLSEGRGERAYLQLTPDLDNFSDGALRALKEYLHSLLPPGEPRPYSLPLRVV